MGFADGRLYSLPTKSAIELTEILIIAAIAETIFSVHTKRFLQYYRRPAEMDKR
jgi:hypothetical protein